MSRSMRQRLPLCHSLHRPSSHPLSTLAASPPSTSRPVLSAPPRLPTEAPKQSPHSQLALTQPSPGLQQAPLFPYAPPLLAPAFALTPAEAHAAAAVPHPTPHIPRAHKRARLQYQLDVGAYGIPKTRAAQHQHHRSFHSRAPPPVPHTHRSVQVGEDAYFVTHNALGIADGVGGWARVAPQHAPYPSPSALFSRRLMHFCAAELEALDSAPFASATSALPTPCPPGSVPIRPPTRPRFSFEHHLKPRPAPAPPLFVELEDSLEELADGIDVLQILERAYDGTVRAHVVPGSSSSSVSSPTPLTTGSSTALIAVLDHPPTGPMKQNPEPPLRNYAAGSLDPSLPSNSNPSPNSSHSHATDPVKVNQKSTPTALSTDPTTQTHATVETKETAHAKETRQEPEYDAVVHIAHLGDCMGMLVRGDEIVWRSDEMWWGYNHPLQLGPPPPGTSVHITTKPASTTATASPAPSSPTSDPTSSRSSSTSNASTTENKQSLIPLPVLPHTFTLPVRASDILILASDGLGDNLWDEDVLDEVLRVRASAGLGFDGLTESTIEKATGKTTTSTEGIMEGLRKAFVGLEVEEGVGAAAAAATLGTATRMTATVYPSPPPSSSPSPPNELASSSASTSSTTSASPSTASSSTEQSGATEKKGKTANAVASAGRRKAFASTLAEALCSRAKRVSERRGQSSLSSSSSSSLSASASMSPSSSLRSAGREDKSGHRARTQMRSQTPAQAHSRTAAEKEAANMGDAPVALGEVPFGRRAALAGRVFRGGKSDDISVIVAVISPSPVAEPEVSSAVPADGVPVNATAGVENVRA